MRILRRAGYRRRTPHKKSASAGRPDLEHNRPHGPSRTGPDRHRRPLDPRLPLARRLADPPLQVHHLAPGTVLIRQSKDVTFEAPFILLLLGERRALLLDTGAVDGTTLRETVDGLVADWPSDADARPTHTTSSSRTPTATATTSPATRPSPTGRTRPSSVTTSTPCAPSSGSPTGPTEVVTLDLGGRTLEIFGIPGHHAASIAVHDPMTGLLHTGDTVYPGRIYVDDPDRPPRHRSTGSSPSPRSAASSTCSAATSR